jgi:hypothetical protein
VVRVSVVEADTVDTRLICHVREEVRRAATSQVRTIEPLRPEDNADAVAYIVTRDRRVVVNEISSTAPIWTGEPCRLSCPHGARALRRRNERGRCRVPDVGRPRPQKGQYGRDGAMFAARGALGDCRTPGTGSD